MIEKPVPVALVFWRALSGEEPVRRWLFELPPEDKRRIGQDIAKVQYGWPVGMPVCRPLGSGLWEVRSSLPSKREARILFGFSHGRLVAVHAFIKKTRTTKPEDIALARRRMMETER